MTTTPEPVAVTTRRNLLRTGAIGAAAAAFLAACGTSSETPPGQSGVGPSSPEVPPTVPTRAPTAVELEYDVTVLRTATSLELVVAEAYATYSSRLDDPTWQAETARFGEDHTSAAEQFSNATNPAKRYSEANATVQESTIDPMADLLTNDDAILGLFQDLESMLAATYITAVSTFTVARWRGRFAAFAGAAARRAALMGSGGEGTAPTAPLFPLDDLIAGEAYVLAGVDPNATTTTEPEG